MSGTSEWTGNLFDFYQEVNSRSFVKSPKPFKLDGAARVDDNEFIKAVRELVINGIIHADYYLSTEVRVLLYPDRLVVENPGTFRASIAKAERGGLSDPRNKALMKTFRLIGAVENSGQGIKRIRDTCRDLGLPEPTFIEDTDPPRVISTMPIWDDREALSDRESKVLEILSRRGTETTAEIGAELGISQSTAGRTIKGLRAGA